jgi:hypothetical protein
MRRHGSGRSRKELEMPELKSQRFAAPVVDLFFRRGVAAFLVVGALE